MVLDLQKSVHTLLNHLTYFRWEFPKCWTHATCHVFLFSWDPLYIYWSLLYRTPYYRLIDSCSKRKKKHVLLWSTHHLFLISDHYVFKQVGGWTQGYRGLNFVTVRGAGHEVPLHRPKQALTLIKSFLTGSPMPVQSSTHSNM